tara:strand:+ start:1190 stop:1825 length:636 start_codon:yes stop_codon:yes gene_type:complete
MPINSPNVFNTQGDAIITGGSGTASIQVQDSFGTTLNSRDTINFSNKEFRVSVGSGTNEGDVVLTGYQDIDTSSATLGENGEANHFRFYNWSFFPLGTVGSIYVFYYPGSNQFRIADNNSLDTTNAYLGIKPNSFSAAQTMITEGLCKVDTTNWGGTFLFTGAPVYLGSNGLTLDSPPITAGDFARVVGYIVDYPNGIIYFKPDDTVIEIS